MDASSIFSRERFDLGTAGVGKWKIAWAEEPPYGVVTIADGEALGLAFAECVVPGCFENDLYELGVVPDPFFGTNPRKVNSFAEKQHVFYAKKFEYTKKEDAEAYLVFEGLDCFAEIYLNGRHAASTANMMIGHEMPADEFLFDGLNEVMVHIRPARDEAVKFEYPQLVDSLMINMESVYARKAAHMYGWDIMPRFISAGVFRPVYIEHKPIERFEEVYLKTVAASDGEAELILHYKFSGRLREKYQLKIEMSCGDSIIEKTIEPVFIAGKTRIAIKNPKLWRPSGRGEAHLYGVNIELMKDGARLDSARFKHGVRTVGLVRTSLTTSTMDGEFVFTVNGEKIFAKGTNWVPADAFHFRDRARIPAMLAMASDLGCNMIRCWGGNIYEDELFYDICDERGILVWQDFGMACSIYPQDDAFCKVIADEAEAVVKRLRSHACVALWSGDNECDQAYRWGISHADPNTNRLTRAILPEAVRVHDGSRPYIGSSPFIDADAAGADERYLTEAHLWGPRNYHKSAYYRNSLCHFVSEIGYHGCPSPVSLKKFISEAKLWPWEDNDEWTAHATAPLPGTYEYRVGLMAKQITELFTETPDNLADFAFASQAAQAEAKKFFIEMFRIAKWKRTGIIWWNLIDGWPQFSDAVVDYYFEKKLAYNFIKNSQQSVCVMLGEPDGWEQDVVLSNDTRSDVTIECTITDAGSGEKVFNGAFTARADSSVIIGRLPYRRNLKRMYTIEWTTGAAGAAGATGAGGVTGATGAGGVNHYLAGQPPFELSEYKKLLEAAGIIPAR